MGIQETHAQTHEKLAEACAIIERLTASIAAASAARSNLEAKVGRLEQEVGALRDMVGRLATGGRAVL